MKKILFKIMQVSMAVAIALSISALCGRIARADSSIQFGSNPLFMASGFLPGNSLEATIKMQNDESTSQNVYIEAINVHDGDAVADHMQLKIFSGSTEIYSDSLGNFLVAGPVALSFIGTGSSTIYHLKISFLSTADNADQGKTVGFDVCAGFSDGTSHCTGDIAATSTPQNIPEISPGGGGGVVSSGGSGSVANFGVTQTGGNSTFVSTVLASTISTIPNQNSNTGGGQPQGGAAGTPSGEVDVSPFVPLPNEEAPLFDVSTSPLDLVQQNSVAFSIFLLLILILLVLLIMYCMDRVNKYMANRSRAKEQIIHNIH